MDGVKQKIEACLKAGFHETDKNLLAEIYKEVFSKTLDIECPKCIYSGRLELKKYYSTIDIKEISMRKAKYQFKKQFAGHKVCMRNKNNSIINVTQETLTDDLAEAMLKNDELKDFIEEVPADKEIKKAKE